MTLTASAVTGDYQFISLLGSNQNFLNPHAVALDSSGNVFVLDSGHNRVLKFSNTGAPSPWATWTGSFNNPQGIALAGRKRIRGRFW